MFTSFNARALGLDLEPTAAIDLAAEVGFEGVDLMVRDLVDVGADPRVLRRRIDDLGLRPGAWPLPIRWREGDADAFARSLDRLPRYAEAAAVLGLRRTGTWVMPESVVEAPDPQATFAVHVGRLGPIAEVLGRFGIRFGLEVIGVESSRTGRTPPFIVRMNDPQLDRLLAALGPPDRVGILADAWHAFAAGEPVDIGLKWGIWRVVWVHLADLPPGAPADPRAMIDDDRGLPGEHGAIRCDLLLRRLASEGYDGPVTAEPLAGCRSLRGLSPAAAARRTLDALRSVWP